VRVLVVDISCVFGFYVNVIRNTHPTNGTHYANEHLGEITYQVGGSKREGVEISNCTGDLRDTCPVDLPIRIIGEHVSLA